MVARLPVTLSSHGLLRIMHRLYVRIILAENSQLKKPFLQICDKAFGKWTFDAGHFANMNNRLAWLSLNQ